MTSDSVNSQTSNDPKGLRIALERIEREAREKTGILNLGGLGLVEPPPELFQLQHLRCLSLGSYDFAENEETEFRYVNKCARNQIMRNWDRLASLPQLVKLSICRIPCDDLAPFAGLTGLRSLDCSSTQVSDLAPLSGLSRLQSSHKHGVKCANSGTLLTAYLNQKVRRFTAKWHQPSLDENWKATNGPSHDAFRTDLKAIQPILRKLASALSDLADARL